MTADQVLIEAPEPHISRCMTAILNEVVAQEKPPLPLWHYTTLSALHGIVESRMLWASDLGFLEDPEELRYGLEFIHDYAEKRGTKPYVDELERAICQSIASAAGIRLASLEARYSRFFSFSLSGADDLLSQWRAYAPAKDGAALGLAPRALVDMAAASDFKLLKCCYDTSKQAQLIDKLIHTIMTRAHAQTASFSVDRTSETPAWDQWIIPATMVLAAMFKRKAFSDEMEWRMVRGPLPHAWPNVRYRLRMGEMVPYIEFVLAGEDAPLPIDTVRLGPGPNQQQRKLAVTALIAEATHGHGTVVQSAITLR